MAVHDPTFEVEAGATDNLLLNNQLCFALYSTSLAMTKVYKPLLHALNLTYPQYLAMLVLWEHDGATVTDISQRLLTDPGSMTPVLKRLEVEGLVKRTRSKEDERVVNLYLTAAGKALQEKARRVPECVREAIAVSEEQLYALQGSLLDLRGRLQTTL
ncbi:MULTISPECIES: MarR family winged helix-turn-helix transcriptional regulator [Pseudomonas]|uniref:MarR family transcriptional regulator n=1 Tax=Pseudomonas quercus TaxID=2722792 RepID=A0ABX0YK59_9PSED|nr:MULTISPECIES: MarR family transcriptional regulator [Pseudomonas]MBF7144750.1 MarR family transcriptional regulator [Pseudomonas sp. LY10J]NJP03287.1 MarR family transcriptional regulator [Pseudomonas quercus]